MFVSGIDTVSFFAAKESGKTFQYICKLCVDKVHEVVEKSSNQVNGMLIHLRSKSHQERFDQFKMEPWRYPTLTCNLSHLATDSEKADETASEKAERLKLNIFNFYAQRVEEKVIREGM